MSFSDYKIDYKRCLGSGVFGTVYEVAIRPENEKGVLSYLFPYLYDYVFSVDEKNGAEKTGLCIKISKTALRIFFESLISASPVPLKRPFDSFFQSSEERRTNYLSRKYGLSKIKFYETSGLYSQFKTKVNGHRFEFYLDNGYFTKKTQYRLRKAFVCFLRAILNPKITFVDIHRKNVMYDELKFRWEIVDGYISEKEDDIQVPEDQDHDNITELLSYDNLDVLHQPFDKITPYVFERMAKVARKGESYEQDMDRKLLRKVNHLDRQRSETNDRKRKFTRE